MGGGGEAGMRHEEDEEEEGGGRKGGRKERMMIRIMTSWALGMCCGDGFSKTRNAILGLSWGSLGTLLAPSWGFFWRSWSALEALFGGSGRPLGALWGVWEPSWGSFEMPEGPLGAGLDPFAKKEGGP